jgi:hypothetical protein
MWVEGWGEAVVKVDEMEPEEVSGVEAAEKGGVGVAGPEK